MATKPHFDVLKAVKSATAQRCEKCQGRVRLYRETKYLAPVWRCEGCGRTKELYAPTDRILDATRTEPIEVVEDGEPVKVMEFK